MAAATLRAQLNRFRPQLGDLVTSIVVAVYLLLFLNVTFWSKAGLYLKNDPSEMHNLINNPEQAKNIQLLKKQLWDLQVRYDDPIRFQYPLN